MNTRQLAAALSKLAALSEERAHLEQQINDVVDALRSPNMDGFCAASWAEIGEALGTTRQAAHKRYAEAR